MALLEAHGVSLPVLLALLLQACGGESVPAATAPEVAKLCGYPDDSGVWYQIVDLPENYRVIAVGAYRGMVNRLVNVHADDSESVGNIFECAGLGFDRDGCYRYYMSERVVQNEPSNV